MSDAQIVGASLRCSTAQCEALAQRFGGDMYEVPTPFGVRMFWGRDAEHANLRANKLRRRQHAQLTAHLESE